MTSSPFQILSLDGGGLKGMFSAAVLAEMETLLKTDVASHFDLISGTSTGGLIALALGAGCFPAEIVDIYTELGAMVFGRPRRLRRIFRPKHGAEGLRSALDRIFGERLLRDSKRCLLIPSYSLIGADVYIFKTPHHSRFYRDGNERMVDVAMATTAAPTYFPAAQLRNNRLIDGGVWANNPALVAIAEAHSTFEVDLADIRMLSLGTTTETTAPDRRFFSGGLAAWARPSGLDVFLRAQAFGGFHTAEHLLRLDKGRLVRIDAAVPRHYFRLDRLDESKIRGLAEHVARIECPHVAPLMTHTAPPPVFYN